VAVDSSPHSREAEEAVLASILVDPSCLDEVLPILKPSDFHLEETKALYGAILALKDRGSPIDHLTVSLEVKGVKGSYLSHIVANLPTSVYAEHYARIVANCSFQRKMIDTSGQIAQLAYLDGQSPLEIYTQVIESITKLEPEDKAELIGPKQHAEEMLLMLNQRKDKKSEAIPFGYLDLDKFLGGMYPGDFIIMAARPSVGKSQVLLEIALYNAFFRNSPVLVCSAEMSLRQIMERELGVQAGLDVLTLRRGELTGEEWGKAQEVVQQVSGMPLYFVPAKLSVSSIMQKARLLQKTHGLKCLMVDYIQLLADKADRKAGDSMADRVGYISSQLKNIARELEIPVLAACQLNRMVESRDGHRPVLSDLRASGDLEQDADVVLLLYRNLYKLPKEDPKVMEVFIGKSRQTGSQGKVARLLWIDKDHRYRNAVEGGQECLKDV
jgi:replicative DNA helicase